jgi:protein TonB
MLSLQDTPPELPPLAEAIMVSVVEAPELQQAKADTPEPPQPPQPPVEQPPPPPDPVVKPDPTPDPEPAVEPDPEPEPVIEHPPVPAPKPKPKPKPQPKPQPVQPKPVETPPAPPPPPTGTPEGTSTPQAPRQGPPKDQPELVSNISYQGAGPQAVYPLASQRQRETGRVMVLVVINPEGNIEKATVVSSSGYSRLDQAALEALRRVRFRPYMRNGVAYTVQAKIPFDFNMRN